MILYRAMSETEAMATLQWGKPVFIRRFKWFSPYLEFVASRVMDGEFNGSKFKPERYTHLLQFEVPDGDLREFVREGDCNWRLDRRRVQMVRWQNIEEAKLCVEAT